MTKSGCWALLLSVLILTGCGGRATTNVSDYVGEYVYTPHQPPPDRFANFLVLRADGTAVEVRYSRSSGQLSTVEKRWSVVGSPTGPIVNVGDFSHTVTGTGQRLQLVINDDVDESYQKVR